MTLQYLRREYGEFAPFLLPRADGTRDEIELVLKDKLVNCDFASFVQALKRLGNDENKQGICHVFLYKDFLAGLNEFQEEQLYEILGVSLGKSLRELSLSFVKLKLTSLSTLLRRTPRLRKLYLGRVSLLQKEHVSAFCSALKHLYSLKEFHCTLARAPNNENPLFQTEEDSFDALLIALSQIESLKAVYLSAYRPRASRVHYPTSLRAIANSSVENFTLTNCHLSAEHVSVLFERSNLTSVALLHAEMGDSGADMVVQALQQPESKLQKLYLSENNLTDESGMAIARAIRSSNLRVLDLHGNHLTAAFARTIAESLQMTTSTLRFLDLSHNPIGDAGGIALACALCDNTELEQLNLYRNHISDGTCAALATALKCNSQLKQLNLYNNVKISKKGAQYLVNHLEHDNYVIERVELKHQPPTLDFFLKLNREFSRGKLLGDSTTEEEYVGGMSKADGDLNSLFYFLRARPSLCEVPAAVLSPQQLALVTGEAREIIGDDFHDFE